MENFIYSLKTDYHFGKECYKETGKYFKNLGKNALVIYGSERIKNNGLLDSVLQSLTESNVNYHLFSGIVANPRLDKTLLGIEFCKEHNCDSILAIGGGSVIDTAKTIAFGVFLKEDLWENYYIKYKSIKKALPLACILTIPAAGSETSPSTVITNTTTNQKIGYASELLIPKLSFVAPELFTTLPKEQLAYGVSDMMSHIFERYFTNTPNTEFSDGISETLLRTIMKNALILVDDYNNYDAWAEIGVAGSFAHNGICGIGRQEDWACHQMEHQLSAFYDIAHGLGLGIVTPSWMKYTYHKNKAMFVQFSINVMGIQDTRDQDKVILLGIKKLEEFYNKLGITTKLSAYGIDDTLFEKMASQATLYYKTIGHFVKLSKDDIVNIYKGSL
jgi:alcohol dehydrogenase YqhD (iron-dependent ADH family)